MFKYEYWPVAYDAGAKPANAVNAAYSAPANAAYSAPANTSTHIPNTHGTANNANTHTTAANTAAPSTNTGHYTNQYYKGPQPWSSQFYLPGQGQAYYPPFQGQAQQARPQAQTQAQAVAPPFSPNLTGPGSTGGTPYPGQQPASAAAPTHTTSSASFSGQPASFSGQPSNSVPATSFTAPPSSATPPLSAASPLSDAMHVDTPAPP